MSGQIIFELVDNILAGLEAFLTVGGRQGNHQVDIPHHELTSPVTDNEFIDFPFTLNVINDALKARRRGAVRVAVLYRKHRFTLGVIPDKTDVGNHTAAAVSFSLLDDFIR